MRQNRTIAGLAMLAFSAFSTGSSVHAAAAGSTADEPCRITRAIEIDEGTARFDDVNGIAEAVYVSRILEGEVAVIDVATDAILRLLHTGSNPAEVGVVPGVGRAFVADLTDGTVTVIGTDEHGIETALNLGVPVATVGVDAAAQRVYALDFSNGSPGEDLHVIDADAVVEVDVFTVGSRTQNIVVDAVADLAYVTDFDEGVNEIDTVTGAVVRNLPLTDLPHGIALDAGAGRLYVTKIDAGSVAIVDTATLTEVDSLTVGDAPQWIAIDHVRAKAFVTNEGDNTVSVIDTAAGTVGPTVIPVGPEPLTITVHEGAAKAYVYNAGDGTISVIDTIGEVLMTTLAPLFADGFESGDTGEWSGVAP
jgi:YVTN family beta-propeller protein